MGVTFNIINITSVLKFMKITIPIRKTNFQSWWLYFLWLLSNIKHIILRLYYEFLQSLNRFWYEYKFKYWLTDKMFRENNIKLKMEKKWIKFLTQVWFVEDGISYVRVILLKYSGLQNNVLTVWWRILDSFLIAWDLFFYCTG